MLIWLCILLWASSTAAALDFGLGLDSQPGRSLFLPLNVRHGLFRSRGLLRNGSLALHGAVKEG
jgi:hypothetical protein